MTFKRLSTAASRRGDVIALLGYLCLAAAFYAPLLLGLRWFPPGDFTDHFLPFSLFQRAELLAGRLPVWNPYTFSGHPFLADVQAAVFYPISNLVLGLTLPWSDALARLYWLQVEAALHISLAGFFTYLLARDLVRNRAAAFLAGGIFAFSGYLTGYPPLQLAVLRTAIWLPLILWCLRRAFVDGTRWRWWILGSLAYAVAFLAGHTQTFLFLSYCVAGWLLFLLLATRGPRSMYAPRIVAFYALFLGLTAAQLVPSVEFTGLSVRANVDYSFVSGGFPLADTWQMLVPTVVSQFSPLYIGLVGLGLALLGLLSPFMKATRDRLEDDLIRRYAVLFFGAVGVLALLASYGNRGFLYPILYKWAPGWSLFRGQERAAYLVAFAMSIAVAYGAVAFASLLRRQRGAVALGWTILAGASVVAMSLRFFILLDERGRTALTRGYFLTGAVLLAVLLVAWLTRRQGRLIPLLAAIALAELFIANAPTNWSAKPVLPAPEAVVLAETVAPAETGLVQPRVQNERRLPEDYGMFVGLEDISGSSPLRLARYERLLTGFSQVRLWELTGTQNVLASRQDLYVPTEVLVELPGNGEPGYVHRLVDDRPRAWVANSIYSAGDEMALPLLGDAAFDLAHIALLPPTVNGVGRPFGLEDGLLAKAGTNEVRMEQIAPAHLRIRVKSESGGFLVVSENWLPGWQATVQTGGGRQQAPVLRTNLAFLGMQVGAGESVVELVYRPASVRYGLLITGLTVLLLAATVVLARRHGVARTRDARIRWSTVASRFAAPGVLLLAFALRAFRLGYQELRGDEALGRLFSLASLPHIVRETIALREPHPVGSYVIQGAWLNLAGHSEFALRFVSLWFSVLAVALIYRLARRLGLAKSTALIGATLLAISPYAVWHSQDARMYGISLALTLASTLLMLEALVRRRVGWWAGYVVVTWLALQTHYYSAYIIVAQNLFVLGRALFVAAERKTLLSWFGAQAATGLLYLPWLIAARETLTGYVGNGDSPTFGAMWLRSLGVFAAGETMPAEQRALLGILVLALALLGAVRLARSGPNGRRALLLLALYLLTPLLATWAAALARPIFNERYIIAAAPGLYLLIAAGLTPLSGLKPAMTRGARASMWPAWGMGLLGVLLVGAMALSLWHYYEDPSYSKSRGWRWLAAVMARHTEGWPADTVRVAQTYPDPTLWYYYDNPGDRVVLPPAPQDEVGAQRVVAELAEQGVERVVIAVQPSEAWDNREIAARALQEEYALLLETPVQDWRVQVYGRSPDTLDTRDVTFADGLRLAGSSIPADRAVAGDVLPVHLRWQGEGGMLTGGEKLTLQLLNEAGQVAAQVDQPFGMGDLTAIPAATYAFALPRTLPAGSYRLIVALYDPSLEGAPRVQTVEGSDHILLKELVSF